jgi:membrane-associated phospholipid phosphatase
MKLSKKNEKNEKNFWSGKAKHAQASRWFLWAAGIFLLLVSYTVLLTSGALNASTAQIEQWLLRRPITRVDCLFYEWRNLGDAPVMLLFTLVLGVICLRLGYRWPVLPTLLLLLLLCVGCEVVGKVIFTQPIPHALSFSMAELSCPQLQNQPVSVHLSAAMGMWWDLPSAPQPLIEQVQAIAHMPVSSSDWYYRAAGYPGGHAIRWSFLGVLTCWLCWRHIKRPAIRWPLMLLALLTAPAGGFMQFYIGSHLVTDTVAGYLLGIAAACCAIGFLLHYDARGQRGR